MSTALKLMTVEEFFPWAEGKEGRWELHDGVPVMMSPERSLHAETKAETYVALGRLSGSKDCHAESIRTAWRSGSTRGRHTNRTHRLSAALALPPDAIEIDNPVIVVEVLSPSTAAIDHGRKFSGYFSLGSVQHYLILDPDRRVVIPHKRGSGDAIETRVLTDGVARVDPPGFEVAVEALFPPA